MNYYETKQLQDRDGRLIGGSIALIIIAPIFGIVAGAIFSSTTAMYVTTGVVVILGMLGIVGTIKERSERKNISS